MNTHKDLEVWKESIKLVKEVYKETSMFPKSEQYSLVDQIRRCAVSVPSNIAEGAARNSNKEYLRFCYISLGSLSELETQLIISSELGFLKNKSVQQNTDIIRRMLLSFIKYLRAKEYTCKRV